MRSIPFETGLIRSLVRGDLPKRSTSPTTLPPIRIAMNSKLFGRLKKLTTGKKWRRPIVIQVPVVAKQIGQITRPVLIETNFFKNEKTVNKIINNRKDQSEGMFILVIFLRRIFSKSDIGIVAVQYLQWCRHYYLGSEPVVKPSLEPVYILKCGRFWECRSLD